MTRTTQMGRPTGAAADFAQARLAADAEAAVQQRQAARRVAERSHDAQDCQELLLMLGLSGLAPSAALPVLNEPATVPFPEALGVHRPIEGALR